MKKTVKILCGFQGDMQDIEKKLAGALRALVNEVYNLRHIPIITQATGILHEYERHGGWTRPANQEKGWAPAVYGVSEGEIPINEELNLSVLEGYGKNTFVHVTSGIVAWFYPHFTSYENARLMVWLTRDSQLRNSRMVEVDRIVAWRKLPEAAAVKIPSILDDLREIDAA